MTTIGVSRLTKSFSGRPSVVALRDVDLTIPDGSITAVVGPSGSGKTTLLRSIAGFEHPEAGEIRFDDQVVFGEEIWVPPERRNVGIVPQEGALFPHLDVAGNIAFPLRHRRRSDTRDRVSELLALVGLSGLEHRRPHQLSGGQQQRVALARALAGRPAVVLLDEPFTALDASLRGALRAEVVGVLSATRSTALIVTHDPTEALAIADTIAVMVDGRIVQSGDPQTVYGTPVDHTVGRLLGELVELHGHVADGRVATVLGDLPIRPTDVTGDVIVLVRPEQIVRDVASDVKAEVRGITFRGHDAEVELAVGTTRMTARWSSVDLPRTGEVVRVRVAGPVVVVPGGP